MRRVVTPLMILLVAVLHAPGQAQALMPSLLSPLLPFATSEPVTLFLTGLALLSLSRAGTGTR